ncbi:MAG: hypothetical protein MUE85_08395 [Microscillaceae bacterium]|jgi:hypothetical protein|nr:hypothetical protein [Microscillaceae bacterium]
MLKILLFLIGFGLILPAQAQDFEKFKALFPLGKKMMPPYSFDSAYFAKCEANNPKLKRLSYSDVKKHIYDKIIPADTSKKNQIFQNSGNGLIGAVMLPEPTEISSGTLMLPEAKVYAQNKTISYYAVENISLIPNHTSLVVYYSDETQKKAGVVTKLVVLLNYDAKGELASAINLVSYSIYMSMRLHTTVIDGNFTVINKEQDFQMYDIKKTGEENYKAFHYYKLDYQNATFKSVQEEYYPYAGRFQAQTEGLEMHIDQNYDSFSVSAGKIKAEAYFGMKINEYDLAKGTFTATPQETEEVWQCVFTEDKNTLTATTPRGIIIFTRLKR